MSVIDTLIFDRTQSDIANNTDKAYIDYNDLNRIEQAVKYLSDVIDRNNYFNKVNVKQWTIYDIRTQGDCARIKENYNILKNAYFYKFETPEFKWEDIEEANRIEEILSIFNNAVVGLEGYFIHSGVAVSSNNRLFQNGFRRYRR